MAFPLEEGTVEVRERAPGKKTERGPKLGRGAPSFGRLGELSITGWPLQERLRRSSGGKRLPKLVEDALERATKPLPGSRAGEQLDELNARRWSMAGELYEVELLRRPMRDRFIDVLQEVAESKAELRECSRKLQADADAAARDFRNPKDVKRAARDLVQAVEAISLGALADTYLAWWERHESTSKEILPWLEEASNALRSSLSTGKTVWIQLRRRVRIEESLRRGA